MTAGILENFRNPAQKTAKSWHFPCESESHVLCRAIRLCLNTDEMNMTPDQTEALANKVENWARQAARQYLAANGLTCSKRQLTRAICRLLKPALMQGLLDGQAAIEANLLELGQMTFRRSIQQAGIEAAQAVGRRRA